MAGCRRLCECGKIFYDSFGSYDWEPGELEALRADPKSESVGYSVGTLSFEGKEYVMDCDCWHKRAEQIMRFVDQHSHKIADYLSLEKKRLQAIADAAPVVK